GIPGDSVGHYHRDRPRPFGDQRGVCAWSRYAAGICRLTRSQVLSLRERDFVLAARCVGAAPLRIMVGHVLPNCVAPLLLQVALIMGISVLAEAALSFLGLGTQPPDPSWGPMLNTGRGYLRQNV